MAYIYIILFFAGPPMLVISLFISPTPRWLPSCCSLATCPSLALRPWKSQIPISQKQCHGDTSWWHVMTHGLPHLATFDDSVYEAGFPLVFHWFSIGFPLVFHWFSIGFPLVFHWFSIGFPLVFHWFSIGFPLVQKTKMHIWKFPLVFHIFPRCRPETFPLGLLCSSCWSALKGGAPHSTIVRRVFVWSSFERSWKIWTCGCAVWHCMTLYNIV